MSSIMHSFIDLQLKEKILRHDRPVPRYTSYPPATQFAPANNADWTKANFAALPHGAGFSLYIHIPFCAQLCHYCGCHTFPTNRPERIDAYLKNLHHEVSLVRQALPEGPIIQHLHFGGGSPTMLSPAQFTALMQHIKDKFKFCAQAEITVEADPRQLTEEKIKTYAACGVNRISFGVQDFNQEVLSAVNRPQPYSLTEQAVTHCRTHGIDNINFDLMYGLPHQTEKTICKTIDMALTLRPSRIAFFGYAHVPWMKNHMKAIDASMLPGSSKRYDIFLMGQQNLIENGYKQIGIDHFVQPGDGLDVAYTQHTLHRNFQGYTTDKTPYLLGIGASAISKFPSGYSQNAPDLKRYTSVICQNELPVQRIYHNSDMDMEIGRLIEEIMCYGTIDLSRHRCCAALTEDYFSTAIKNLRPLLDDGLAELREDILKVKAQPAFVSRLVAAAFDIYFPPNSSRHAIAV